VVLLLGGNLAVSLVRGEGGSRLITAERARTVAFWAAVCVTAAASAAGLVWAVRAYREHERSSLLWTQRACAAGLVAAAVFSATAWDTNLVPHEWLACVYATAFCAQSVFVAVLAYREHWRSLHGESRAHHARRGAPELLDAPPPSAAPPESTGPAK
jgi:hypothetical protein